MRSVIKEYRPPTRDEVQASRYFSAALENAQIRGRRKSYRPSERPTSGKLIRREARRLEVQEQLGQRPTAKPFLRTIHHRAEEPPLRVGVVLDLSGSMNQLAEITASLVWILTQASHRLDARLVATWFGDSYGPLLKESGLQPTGIPVYRAEGYTYRAPEALRMCNTVLQLEEDTSGSRIMIVLTDGGFSSEKEERFDSRFQFGETIEDLADSGVTVLVVTPTAHYDKYFGKKSAWAHVEAKSDVLDTVKLLAKVLVDELKKA